MIGVSEMFDADRYDNFDAEFRFSRQGLIKANHPRVTILVFVACLRGSMFRIVLTTYLARLSSTLPSLEKFVEIPH